MVASANFSTRQEQIRLFKEAMPSLTAIKKTESFLLVLPLYLTLLQSREVQVIPARVLAAGLGVALTDRSFGVI